MLTIDQAQKNILAKIKPIKTSESVSLNDALHRVLCKDIESPFNVPQFCNSAMDGYALRARDLQNNKDRNLMVKATIHAAQNFQGELRPGQCVRIMTGARVPDGLDSVVPFEQVLETHDGICVEADVNLGQFVRRIGEDVAKGSRVFKSGHRLSAADIGVLASLGIACVPVYQRLTVAVVSTGDELRSLDQPLGENCIYNSNFYALSALMTPIGIDVLDMGIVPDDPEQLERVFTKAQQCADVIISCGGVSVGDADYTKQVLERIGVIDFWKIRMRPGKPFAFGTCGDAVFFGLPGNPVSTMVTYFYLVKPALRYLQGELDIPKALQFKVPVTTELRKSQGRAHYMRGLLTADDQGRWQVSVLSQQNSNVLTSMSIANCFVIIPPEVDFVPQGDDVWVHPFIDFSLSP